MLGFLLYFKNVDPLSHAFQLSFFPIFFFLFLCTVTYTGNEDKSTNTCIVAVSVFVLAFFSEDGTKLMYCCTFISKYRCSCK